MKRAICILIVILFTFTGCSSGTDNKKAEKLSLNTDACIAPLKWSMTETEARQALKGYTISDSTVTGSKTFFTFDAELFSQTVSVSVGFKSFSADDVSVLTEKSEPLLNTIQIMAKDKDNLNKQISAVLGPQQTTRIGYYDYDGETGSNSAGDLEEEDRYWCSDKSLSDVFDKETLKKMAPDNGADETRFLMSSDKRMYYVKWAFQDDGKVVLIFDATVGVLTDLMKNSADK